MNPNSAVNMRIKDRFVDREVLACISDMAEMLFDESDQLYADYEEFDNYYRAICPECGESDIVWKFNEGGSINYVCTCGKEFTIEEFDELEREVSEVYEWWIVTSWLGQRLREHGEVVLDRLLGWIWGRRTTGQAISLDGVITDICEEMEILEGQAYDWSKQGVA